MKQTENIGLNLPEGPDLYNEKDYNENFEIIDEKLNYLATHISGDVEELTVTENGVYTAPQGKSYNPVNVGVVPDLEEITITENGVYTPTEGKDGISKVTANVGEPNIKIVSQFDFNNSEYDSIRSHPELNEHYLVKSAYAYDAVYDASLGVVKWSNGYGYWDFRYYFNYCKNYLIDIDLGECATSGVTGNKQVFSIMRASGASAINLYWSSSNNRFEVSNSSGTLRWDNYNDLSILNNANLGVKIEMSIGQTYSINTTAYFKFNRNDETEAWKDMGGIDTAQPFFTRVGQVSSQNGLYPMQVKGGKITEIKWNPAQLNLLTGQLEETEEPGDSEQR